MALLVLQYCEPAAVSPLSLASVRHWLRGDWGLLFSHPDDFGSYGFEADRWLVPVQQAFRAASVRPLATTSDISRDQTGWVADAGGRFVVMRDNESQRYPRWRQSPESALCAAVQDSTSRFVMTLDGSLRLRRTLTYTRRDQLPSPMGLAAIAASIRTPSAPACRCSRP